jgi:hypothetical protein
MRILEIYPHLKENSNIKVYDYQIYFGDINRVDKILSVGRTCEIKTLNEDYQLELTENQLGNYGGLFKLKD